jgi:FkbM family methyltransferase
MPDVRESTPYGVSLFDDWPRYLQQAAVRTVFDVGAHEGQSLLELAAMFPDAAIFSFEPAPQTFAALSVAARAYPNARVFNLALGDTTGPQAMLAGRHSCLNSLMRPDVEFAWPTSRLEERMTIECETLDRVAAAVGGGVIDGLKIDFQGAEQLVLAGADGLLSAGRVRSVKLEVLFLALYESQPTFSTLLSIMAGYGFRFTGLYDAFYDANGWLGWADALFIHASERVDVPLPQLP